MTPPLKLRVVSVVSGDVRTVAGSKANRGTTDGEDNQGQLDTPSGMVPLGLLKVMFVKKTNPL